MTVIQTILGEHDEPVTKPPTRWVNKWKNHKNCFQFLTCYDCNTEIRFKKNDIIATHCYTYPSKDVAESEAEKISLPDCCIEYLGAYPVDKEG